MTPAPRAIGVRGMWWALWQRPRALWIGVWFTVVPVMLILPISLLVTSISPKQPDHARIRAAGTEAPAEVIRVETVYSITINDVHPRRVFFKYRDEGISREASMDTMSVDLVSAWRPGHAIVIKHLDGQATVPELQTVDFPMWLFEVMPLVFAAVGIPLLVYALVGAATKKRLLQYGQVQKAKLLSMTPVQSFGTFGGSFFKTRFDTNYAFVDEGGMEAFGRSLTTDLKLLNEKKTGDEIEILALPGHPRDTLVVDTRVRALLGAGP